MIQSDQLAFTDAIADQRFDGVFEKHHGDVGSDPDTIVRDIAMLLAMDVEATVERDTALTETEATESRCPEVIANVKSEPVSGRILLVDGFTVTMTDTPENQAAFPQNPVQKEGIGFPILRGVTLISRMTGMLFDCETGPDCGKESGETALLWKLLSPLRRGDILVADSYDCTCWLIAACLARGVQIVMKNHHQREDHPAAACRINTHQRTVLWDRPPCPEGMSEEVDAEQPATVEIRLVDVQVQEAGFRTMGFTVATTILDHKL